LLDRTHFVEGLVLANFRVKNGVVVVHTVVTANANNNTYALTIPAASVGTYTVELFDSVLATQLSKFQQDYCLNLT
jgi:hypothetical protein